jgi:eukaryotic-like serine/threonine-protein kinase
MSSAPKLSSRYEIKEIIGEGGMGIVYRAIDLEVQSDVALKTIKELLSDQQIELFRRECAVLRKLRHPNIVDLYDFGVSQEAGQQKPFFVMPFLPGATLDRLIRSHAARLTPDRVVDIITQTARGLQAAHDLGLVHRDVKPSNIFVLSDDSVKLIDFGVVHVTDQNSRTGFKGTLAYMSPEQLELAPPTAVSDVFSLAAVCYEALTRRRPFNGNTEHEIRESILHVTPPPISELNPAVSLALSQVVHAAMAKQPWNRTSTARQFAEELQRALHGQPIDRFDPNRIEPRIARAQKALESSQYDFAADILGEIEAEGHIHPTIQSLRRQIDQAIRAKSIRQALESAQHRFKENEYQLALQKVDEVLRLDPNNADAIALKTQIDGSQRTQQIENWFRLAQDHVKNYAFNHARQALQNVLRIKPTNTMALQMLSDVDRRENEYAREHREKEELYKAALEAWHRGEISAAMSKLERVLELDRRAPDNASSEAVISYQNLYNQVRSEHDRIKNAYEEARRLLSENDFNAAFAVCEEILAKFPDHALFQALKFDIGERQRQYVSSYIVKIDRDVEAEPDLDRKVAILIEADRLYPEEAHFRERLDKISRRRDLVTTITQKVANLEERGQYAEALGQLEILRAIYPQYPGIDLMVDRITKRRDRQSRAEVKARWVNQIDTAINLGDFSHALSALKSALSDFPDDAELLAQERLAHDGQERCLEAARILEHAQALHAEGNIEEALDELLRAYELDQHSPVIRAVLVESLLKRAAAVLDQDPKLSERLVSQVIELDPANTLAGSLQRMITQRQKDRAVDGILSKSREVQASADPGAALAVIENGLISYPDEQRLLARKEALLKTLKPAKHVESVFKPVDEDWAPSAVNAQAPKENSFLDTNATVGLPSSAQKVDTPAVSNQDSQGSSERAASRKFLSPKRLAIFGAIAATVAVVVWVFVHKTPPPPLPTTITWEGSIDASVAGAHIFVDGQDRGVDHVQIKLAEGEHKIDAVLPGFSTKEPVIFRVGDGTPRPPSIALLLVPLQPVLRVSTEFQQGTLDGEKLMLDGTGYEKADLANGPHVLELSHPVAGTIHIEFDINAGQAPVVRKIDSSQTLVVALASLKDHGQLYSNSKSLKVGVNGAGAAIVGVGDQGTALTLSPYRNVLVLDDSKTPLTVSVDEDDKPGLTIFVGSQPSAGNLEITETGKVDAFVSVQPSDNKGPSRTQKLKNGKTTFSRLEPKSYLVQLSAAGYETARFSISVKKGDVVQAPPVSLKPLPTTATLDISAGTPDADIFVDNNSVGKLGATRSSTYTVAPGKHRIQFRKSDFEDSAPIELDFTAGQTQSITAPNLRPYGWIEFDITPSSSTITYSFAGTAGSSATARPGDMPHMRAGRYSIKIGAAGYKDYSNENFEVEPGKGKTLTVALDRILTTVPPPGPRPIVIGKEGFDGSGSNSSYNLFKDSHPGTYSFKIKQHRSPISKKAKWVVDFVNNTNYVEYEINDKTLKYTLHQGQLEYSKSVQHSIQPTNDIFELTVTVTANEIIVASAGKQIPLETPTGLGNLLNGRFGFPKNEEWDANTFRFTQLPVK